MPAAKLPLFKHRNGQWCKKIKGKLYYFGTDYDKALDAYLEDKDHLHAGRGKPKSSDSPTIAELANLYYDGCRKRVSAGDLSQGTLDESERTIKRLIAIRGEKDHPGEWEPLDFQAIKQELFIPVPRGEDNPGGRKVQGSRRSATTVGGDIRRIKAFLNWCCDSKLIQAPHYGREFSESTARAKRLARQAAGKRVFDAKSLNAIIATCRPNFLPVVLLGINGGMGARDIAGLTIEQVAGVEWLDCPRQKTGAERRVWLWPETRQAIKVYLRELRHEPWRREYDDIAFLTTHRTPWIRGKLDSATQMFTKARQAADIDSGTFYDLRRTFQTVGEETRDFPAVQFCMGHVPPANDMSAKYREISDDRVEAVCKHVRKWLFGK